MRYPYKCQCCGNHWEVIKSVKDIDLPESCPGCQNVDGRRYISRTHFYGAAVEDAEYNPGLGCIVKNKKHRAEIAARNNLVEIGNECPTSTHDTLKRDKEKSYEEGWAKV